MLFHYLRDKKKKKQGESENGEWKFTHFTSPGSAPAADKCLSIFRAKWRLLFLYVHGRGLKEHSGISEVGMDPVLKRIWPKIDVPRSRNRSIKPRS